MLLADSSNKAQIENIGKLLADSSAKTHTRRDVDRYDIERGSEVPIDNGNGEEGEEDDDDASVRSLSEAVATGDEVNIMTQLQQLNLSSLLGLKESD